MSAIFCRGNPSVVPSLGQARGPAPTADDVRTPPPHGGHLACVVGLPDLGRLEPFTKAVSIHEIALGSAHLSGSRKAQTDLAVMGEELIAMVQKGSLSTLLTETINLADVPQALSRLSRRQINFGLNGDYIESEPGEMPADIFEQHHVMLNLRDEPQRIEHSRDGVSHEFIYHKDEIAVTHASVRSSWRWDEKSKVIITLEPDKLQ